MRRRWAAAACALLLAAGCTGRAGTDGPDDVLAEPSAPTNAEAPPGAYQPFTVLGQIADRSINESSGLAASRRNPGLLWTHNDSDDDPIVYCLDLEGRSCGAWKVTGAEAFDWEDVAAGPGPRAGEPYLYVGDIGDNIDQRSEIVVYRIPEPTAGAGGAVPTKASPAATAPAEALRLRYPDGPHNAEALLVHPATGDIYVVIKEPLSANVYKADPDGVLQRIAGLAVGAGLVTGGDISPDGRRVALCTYAGGFELELPAGVDEFDAIWEQPLKGVDLPPRTQGEAVAYRLDGNALLTTSELAPAPLSEVART